MSFFSDICHEGLLHELREELGTPMILYTVDGYAYFGRLAQILDCRVGVLVSADNLPFVLVRHPDQTFGPQETTITEAQTYVDLCTVVAKTSPQNQVPPGFGFID